MGQVKRMTRFYNDEELSKIKELEKGILKDFIELCEENNLRYFGMGGTCLGAVRHGGYIPWDDDIDIAMLRPDYEKFMQEYKDDVYRFVECRLDKDVHIGFGKVEDTRTIVIEGGNTKNLGVSIDVFPIDDLRDTYEDSIKYFKSFKWNRLIRKAKYRELSIVKSFSKKIAVSLLKVVCFPFSVHSLTLKNIKCALKDKKSHSKYVGLICDVNVYTSEVMERSIWSEYQPISFEGKTFIAVKDTDSYLTCLYGDYMKLPPKEQQIPKHDFEAIYWK